MSHLPGNPKASRRLAAILAADIAGYSALMGSDEEATVRDLKENQAVILPMITEDGGRVIDTAGDGILAEFTSVLGAVKCALGIQKTMAERNASVDPVRRMQFRIGINLGDVIVDDARAYGDGVNVAARLESIAEPGGICVSGKVHDEIVGKIDVRWEDLGRHSLKNIALPIRVYRINAAKRESTAALARPSLALPDKPSIAVLPFANLSGDKKQEYFSDGITEDIITELSRFSELFVIARNSSFHYKGKSPDIRQVGRELGVRYVLEGSIRWAGDRVRITGQLIDATTGAHRWADRYDRRLEDIFELQDEVARAIASILTAHVDKAERERTLLKPPSIWEAYDFYMRAADAWATFLTAWRKEELYEVRGLLEKALSLDPKFARTYTLLASTYRVAWLNALDSDHLNPQTLKRAIELVRTSIELNANLPYSYAELGYLIARRGEYDAAVAAFERASALNPNFADYRFSGVLALAGEHERAIIVAKAHMRLDPFHPLFAPQWLGIANYLLRRYTEAQRWLAESTGRAPDHMYGRAWLAATYAQLGRLDLARVEAAEVLRIKPNYTIDSHRFAAPYKRAEDAEHLADGLRKAGLPER
jgi:adenylate cyclase